VTFQGDGGTVSGMVPVDTADRIDFPILMTAGDVAEVLRVSPRTVRRWASEGHLEAVRLAGHSVRFTARSVQALLRNDLELAANELEGKGLRGGDVRQST
jgi:excisionase family DNA binding protein